MDPKDPLKQDLDRCYRVFSRYPRPSTLEASPYRDAGKILRNLSAAPLKHLDSEDLGSYAGYALTTVGNEDDYKHFLPRILEHAVKRSPYMGFDPAIIGEKLKLGEWSGWPLDEQEAIRHVFNGAWRQSLQHHPDDVNATEWLCGLAVLDLDVADAIALWRTTTTENAVLQLSDLVTGEATFLLNPELGEHERGYWPYASAINLKIIGDWLLSGAVDQQLAKARNLVEHDDKWRIDDAIRDLRELVAFRLQ